MMSPLVVCCSLVLLCSSGLIASPSYSLKPTPIRGAAFIQALANMEISRLLERIRTLNIEALAAAVASAGPAHVEPALRRADGSLATEGEWNLPVRVDFLLKGQEAQGTEPVTPSKALSFDRCLASLDDVQVDIGPFGWDWCEIVVDLPPSRVGPSLQGWFMDWFDPEDQNSLDSAGFFGVVHFASDPEPAGEGAKFAVDLGSAPIACFPSLFSRLSDAGVRSARVGQL